MQDFQFVICNCILKSIFLRNSSIFNNSLIFNDSSGPTKNLSHQIHEFVFCLAIATTWNRHDASFEGESTETEKRGHVPRTRTQPRFYQSRRTSHEMNSNSIDTRPRGCVVRAHAQATKLKGWTRSGQLGKNYISTKKKKEKRKKLVTRDKVRAYAHVRVRV